MSVLDYQAAIQITFDKAIVTDPAIITGTEYYKPSYNEVTPMAAISSSDRAGYPKEQAFDGSVSTYWRANSTTSGQWIGRDYAGPVTLCKFQARADTVDGRIKDYKLQGSSDGATWVDVVSGTFTDSAGWQGSTFAATTYRYWRLYMVSKYWSYYTCTELEFYTARSVYSTAGWTVTGYEHDCAPGGNLLAATYTVHKVTKTPDNLSVILWLDVFDRMRSPVGLVTVSYDKTLGNLQGALLAAVNSFSLTFTPNNIVRYDNPNDAENLTAQIIITVTVSEIAYKYMPAESNTFLILDWDNPYMDENISAYANMTIIVTNVGGLPL